MSRVADRSSAADAAFESPWASANGRPLTIALHLAGPRWLARLKALQLPGDRWTLHVAVDLSDLVDAVPKVGASLAIIEVGPQNAVAALEAVVRLDRGPRRTPCGIVGDHTLRHYQGAFFAAGAVMCCGSVVDLARWGGVIRRVAQGLPPSSRPWYEQLWDCLPWRAVR